MNRWETAFQLVGLGWYVGACIFLGVAGGLWLDNKFDTKPLFVILGLLLGVFTALYGFYKMILPNLNKKNNKQNGGKG